MTDNFLAALYEALTELERILTEGMPSEVQSATEAMEKLGWKVDIRQSDGMVRVHVPKDGKTLIVTLEAVMPGFESDDTTPLN